MTVQVGNSKNDRIHLCWRYIPCWTLLADQLNKLQFGKGLLKNVISKNPKGQKLPKPSINEYAKLSYPTFHMHEAFALANLIRVNVLTHYAINPKRVVANAKKGVHFVSALQHYLWALSIRDRELFEERAQTIRCGNGSEPSTPGPRGEWVCGVNPSLIKPIPFQMTVGKPMINAISWGLGTSDTATKAISLSRSQRRSVKVVLHLLNILPVIVRSRDPLTCQRSNCKRIDCSSVKGPWEFHRTWVYTCIP